MRAMRFEADEILSERSSGRKLDVICRSLTEFLKTHSRRE